MRNENKPVIVSFSHRLPCTLQCVMVLHIKSYLMTLSEQH